MPRTESPDRSGRPGQPDWDRVNVVVSPAWYDDYVLTVGSVDPKGAPSSFSLAGPWVDVGSAGRRHRVAWIPTVRA